MALQLSAQNTEKKVPPPPPPPPPPAAVPAPPPPPTIETVKFTAPVIVKDEVVKFTPPAIVNNKGYNISVKHINGVDMVQVKSKKMKKLIPLSDWNAKSEYYENLYGELPPPPPPPPVIKKES